MLYLKNSLVNLIILFSLFFLTISMADDNNFIFPKKKLILNKTSEKKDIKIQVNDKQDLVDLPQRKPLEIKRKKSKNLEQTQQISNLIKKKKRRFQLSCRQENQT